MLVHLNEVEVREHPTLYCANYILSCVMKRKCTGMGNESPFPNEVATVKLASEKEFVIRAIAIVHLMNSQKRHLDS